MGPYQMHVVAMVTDPLAKAHPLEISVHIGEQYIVLIAKRLSARQLILHRISPSVCIYVCVTLRNAILLQARVQGGVIQVTWMPPLYFWRTKD